jgi:hypothetical protein
MEWSEIASAWFSTVLEKGVGTPGYRTDPHRTVKLLRSMYEVEIRAGSGSPVMMRYSIRCMRGEARYSSRQAIAYGSDKGSIP